MRDLKGKRVLVTGSGAGIGRVIAERFAHEGSDVVLADINETALAEAGEAITRAGGLARAYKLDVGDGDSILRLRDELHRDAGPIDVLVNNAGVVYGGAFLDVPLAKHLATFRVNVIGLVAVTHAFLPDLIAQPEGHLVNIASAAGMIGLPFGSTYASSKWAVMGFSESIRLELSMLGTNTVHVTTVCPSYVSTGLFEGARPAKMTSMLTPEGLADMVLEAVKKDRIYVLTPWLVKVTPILKGMLPTRVFDAVAWTFGATSSMAHWKGRGQASV